MLIQFNLRTQSVNKILWKIWKAKEQKILQTESAPPGTIINDSGQWMGFAENTSINICRLNEIQIHRMFDTFDSVGTPSHKDDHAGVL